MKNLKEKLSLLKKRAEIRKKTHPSIKETKDVIVENNHATDLMPLMYQQITEVN